MAGTPNPYPEQTPARITDTTLSYDPDILAQPLETNADMVANDSVYDEDPPVEEAPAYFPPTDPVITSDAAGNIHVLNGFAPTAMSAAEDVAISEDHRYGDEAKAETIGRALKADALTTDLTIVVHVLEGVAYLRGSVPSLQDALNAEEVASRVPGIAEVVEELDVLDLV